MVKVSNEENQKLIDIMFKMVLFVSSDKSFCKKPRGEKMAWVANQLRSYGFDTHPIGMSWGVLVDPTFRNHVQVITDNIDNC